MNVLDRGGALTSTTNSPFPRHCAPEGPNPPLHPSPPASPFKGSSQLPAKANPTLIGNKERGFSKEPPACAANLLSSTQESPRDPRPLLVSWVTEFRWAELRRQTDIPDTCETKPSKVEGG